MLHITMNFLVQKFKSIDKIANEDQSLLMKVCFTSINCFKIDVNACIPLY